MKQHLREERLATIVARWALVIASAIAIIFPTGYFALAYKSHADSLQIRAQVKAGAITTLIVTKNPQLWPYQIQRLEELLSRYPEPFDHEKARVLDAGNKVLVNVGNPLDTPVLRQAYPVYESGRVVGRVEVERSFRDVIYGTVLAAFLGLLLGGFTYAILRVLPLRALRRVTLALREEKERAEVTLKSIGDAVITVGSDERIEYLNPVAERLTGWVTAEAEGRPISDILRLISEDTLEPLENPLRRALTDNRITSFGSHTALIRRDETTVAIEHSAAPIHDGNGHVTGGVLVFHDVSAARTMAQRLTWSATHDALTGLVNRREFESRVEAALASARNSSKHHALCYLDLDQFKIVNDTSGHAAGDGLLKQIATLLQSKLRESDTLARLGGDEFGVLLDGCPLDRAQLIAADLLAAVRDFRFKWEDKAFTIGVSIGLVAITRDSSSGVEIFSAADSACYAAKEQGRNRVHVFHRADSDIAHRRREMDWVGRINRAMDEHRLVLYYQSYLPLTTAAGAGNHLEILLRMVDEEGNLILPGSFLPAAERYNLMPAIDRWVIETVFGQYRTLVSQFEGQPLMCAINLSGTSLNDDTFLDFIREQARVHALPHGAICFEITETVAINNLRKVAQFMKEIQALGFLFALDDFGSGTSSFGYLKNLPVDYLKIDGGFVKDMMHDPLDKAMTETINRIGHIVGVKTVAEFAESDAIIDDLKAMGVDFAQGYAVGKPRPLSEAGAKAA